LLLVVALIVVVPPKTLANLECLQRRPRESERRLAELRMLDQLEILLGHDDLGWIHEHRPDGLKMLDQLGIRRVRAYL
jgi:hypothetical protein